MADARRGQKAPITPGNPGKGGVGIAQQGGWGPSTVQANSTAKYVQSFDEISVRQEEPAPTDGYVPRGSPKRDTLFDDMPAVPQRLQAYDERQNTRSDNQTFFRDTPQSAKDKQDKRPDWLYKYTSEAGEDIT